MPKAPTAQRSSAPPVNMLYMPRRLPAPCLLAFLAMYSASAPPSKPGIGIMAATRQMPSTIRVKRIRDFNSGILKQFAKVLAMAESMAREDYFLVAGGVFAAGAFFAAAASLAIAEPLAARGRFTNTSHVPPLPSILDFAEALKACALTVNFRVNSPSPKILIPAALPLARPALRSAS